MVSILPQKTKPQKALYASQDTCKGQRKSAWIPVQYSRNIFLIGILTFNIFEENRIILSNPDCWKLRECSFGQWFIIFNPACEISGSEW